MKKFKILGAMLAIVIAVTGSAYTVNHAAKKTDPTYFYKYIGTSTADNDLLMETNWKLVDDAVETGCSAESGVNCVIEVTTEPDGLENPDFDALGIDTRGELDDVTETYRD